MTKTLILVHPGSLVGSANMNLGKSQAGAVRDGIQLELEKHEGPIFVIDGALSCELEWSNLGPVIKAALERNRAAGHLTMRLWGDDGGDAPYDDWTADSTPSWVGKVVFEGQEEAATAISGILPKIREIVVTGAWVDGDTGCVVSVAQALRGALGEDASISISEWAADMADADEIEDDEDIDFDLATKAIFGQ